MRTRAITLVAGTMMCLAWAGGSSLAQGANAILVRSTGESVEGELLVASDTMVILRTDSSTRNIWWMGDSAFAMAIPLSQVERITIPGNSALLLGTGIGVLAGSGYAVLQGLRGGDAGASVIGGGLAGLVMGALVQRGEKVFERGRTGGFHDLREHARFGAVTPAILQHLE
ncbi:MAG TPA: hypothetical protein VLT13_06755 [Bacteroidota bacterium]|nr:hypothetical protein [Bacteroidota bacterium]